MEVLPAGVPVSIMIYEKTNGSGLLITCTGNGQADSPAMVTGEVVKTALLGGFDLDIEQGDRNAEEKVRDLLKGSFGDKTLVHNLQVVKITAKMQGFPLE